MVTYLRAEDKPDNEAENRNSNQKEKLSLVVSSEQVGKLIQ